MSATGFLTVGGGSDSLDCALKEVAELKSLDEVTKHSMLGLLRRIPNRTAYEFQIMLLSLMPTWS